MVNVCLCNNSLADLFEPIAPGCVLLKEKKKSTQHARMKEKVKRYNIQCIILTAHPGHVKSRALFQLEPVKTLLKPVHLIGLHLHFTHITHGSTCPVGRH